MDGFDVDAPITSPEDGPEAGDVIRLVWAFFTLHLVFYAYYANLIYCFYAFFVWLFLLPLELFTMYFAASWVVRFFINYIYQIMCNLSTFLSIFGCSLFVWASGPVWFRWLFLRTTMLPIPSFVDFFFSLRDRANPVSDCFWFTQCHLWLGGSKIAPVLLPDFFFSSCYLWLVVGKIEPVLFLTFFFHRATFCWDMVESSRFCFRLLLVDSAISDWELAESRQSFFLTLLFLSRQLALGDGGIEPVLFLTFFWEILSSCGRPLFFF